MDDTRTAEQIRADREANADYWCVLALDNIDHVVTRIRRILGNGQRYTYARAYAEAGPSSMPELKTHQQVERPDGPNGTRDWIAVHKDEALGVCSFTVFGPGLEQWGASSDFRTEDEARRHRSSPEEPSRREADALYIHGGNSPTNYLKHSRIEITSTNQYGVTTNRAVKVEFVASHEAAETEAVLLDRAAALLAARGRAASAQILWETARETRDTWASQLPTV